MARQFSTAFRDAAIGQLESTVGTTPVLRIFSGSPPANCAAANTGTELANGNLPSDWLGAASSGSVSKNGTWTLTGQSGAGGGTNAGYYRLYASNGTTCHEQGTVTATGGGGDMTIDNISIANGQTITVTAYAATMPGA